MDEIQLEVVKYLLDNGANTAAQLLQKSNLSISYIDTGSSLVGPDDIDLYAVELRIPESIFMSQQKRIEKVIRQIETATKEVTNNKSMAVYSFKVNPWPIEPDQADEKPQKFSIKHGYSNIDQNIIFREDAPSVLRNGIISISTKRCGLKNDRLAQIFWEVLRRFQHVGVRYESISDWYFVRDLFLKCKWFNVYDIIEGIYSELVRDDLEGLARAAVFESAVNEIFFDLGAGWKLSHGIVEFRGEEIFEIKLNEIETLMEEFSLHRAKKEIRESIICLSRRPAPDLTGAITHSMGALECVAREFSGDRNLTLGEIIKSNQQLFPKPLDVALEKIWGYASEKARHIKEGVHLQFVDANLIAGLSLVITQYLIQKCFEKSDSAKINEKKDL